MPQLNSATFVSQIFWLVVSFLIMWFLVANVIAPKIADIIQQRQRKIDDYLLSADKFRQTAEDLVSRYDNAMKKAEQASALAWAEAKDQLEEQSKKMRADMTERLQASIDKNEKELSQITTEINSKVNSLAVDLAMQVLQKMNIATISKEQVVSAMQEESRDAGNCD